jgi:dipeptidyl aminopeptidase/acylaminoacyl peptidase
MPSTKTAPYGSWKSPITSDLIVEQTTVLSEVRLVGNDIYWLEGRPREQGRNVIVRASRDSAAIDITPTTFNARTRVHEYGGASWLVAGETCIFSNFADQRLYLQRAGQSAPEPLTPAPLEPKHHFRYGDGVLDEGRQRWIGVREDHTREGEPVNTIVAIDLDQAGASPGRVLVGGKDFFSSARLSPDGNRMAWLAWDHPNMPWNGTTLYLADIGADGVPAATCAIAGGVTESVFQPEWSPDGTEIIFVSDRTGWWNLYAYEIATGTTRALCPMQAEFGAPQWNLGMSMYAFASPRLIVCAYTKAGLGQLALLDLTNKSLEALDTGFTQFGSVCGAGGQVVFRAKQATELLDRAEPRFVDYLTKVEPLEFPTSDGKTAFGLFYPPHNPDYVGTADERPPCSSNAMAVLPRRHRAPSASGRNSGRAAGSRCLMSTTAAAPDLGGNIANG